MSPRKKKAPIDQQIEAATIAAAHAKVAANPRGAPETIRETAAPPVVVPATATVAERPCAIDGAMDGAKCVVSRTETGKAVRLLTPMGVEELPKDDIAYTLPAGAKIRKVQHGVFEGYRLGVAADPIFTVTTGRGAVARFLEVVT